MNSIKARMKNKFNVSIAEIGEQDKWQKAVLGMATISNDRRFVNEVLDKTIALIASYPEVEIVECRLELI